MNFQLKSIGDTCDVYEWINKNEMERVIMFHWKEDYKNTIQFERQEFVLNNEALFIPMQAEKDKWIKHSAKYGHWVNSNHELDVEALEFAINVLKGEV